jgi:hypothetical protein
MLYPFLCHQRARITVALEFPSLLIDSPEGQVSFGQHSLYVLKNHVYFVAPINDDAVGATPELQKLVPIPVN